MPEKITLQGKKVVGGKVQGEAIVSREPISFFGGVDRFTGIVQEPGHPLEGKSLAKKILVYPTGKGSTGGSYCIYDMATRETGPKALVMIQAEPIATVGAIMGDMPVVASLEDNILDIISDGDYLEVDGDSGVVLVSKKEV